MAIIGPVLEQLDPFTFYDTFTVGGKDAKRDLLQLLNEPLGPRKGLLDTNLDNNPLPAWVHHFSLARFEIELIDAASDEALKTFMWRSAFDFSVSYRTYWRCLVGDLLVDRRGLPTFKNLAHANWWRQRFPSGVPIRMLERFEVNVRVYEPPKVPITARLLMRGVLYQEARN